jgi:hypothetical protein
VSGLERIVQLCELLERQAAEVEQLTEDLRLAKAAMLRTEREDLPDLMTELGLSELKLSDGSVVSLKEEVDARITDDTRPGALRWLLDHGFGGLIKTEVALTFGRGEHDEAVRVADELQQHYENIALKEDVHHSTLRAFVREQMAAGTAVPMDLFHVHPYSKATIKRNKK